MIVGKTADSEVLHRYLSELATLDLVAKAELTTYEHQVAARGKSANSAAFNGGLSRFEARVVLRPGYGQPGGPTGERPLKPSKNDNKVVSLEAEGPRPREENFIRPAASSLKPEPSIAWNRNDET